MFASILEWADGVPQWWKVGKEGPGSLKVRWPFLTVLALMVRGKGSGRRWDKRLIAAGTSWLLELADGLPARAAEEGDRVSAEWMATGNAFHRQHKSESLTAPSNKPILGVFAYHRRGSVPINACMSFFLWECAAPVKVVAL
jgi:hypothetical protein